MSNIKRSDIGRSAAKRERRPTPSGGVSHGVGDPSGSVQGTRLAASRAGLGQRTSLAQPSCSNQRMIRALESS